MYHTVKPPTILKTMNILCWVLLYLSVCPAESYGGDIISTGKDAAGIFFRDGCRIVSSPFRITGKQLPKTGGVIGLVLFSSFFDRSIHSKLRGWESRDIDTIRRATESFGRVSSIRYAGALVFLGGFAAGKTSIMWCGAECFKAGIFTAELSAFFKKATGRMRPHVSSDPFRFFPFKKGNSLPSSHSAQAFTAASVFSEYTPAWADWVLYAASSSVAFLDMYKNRHWLSDIIAGSVLGYVTGKSVVRGHRGVSPKSKKGKYFYRLIPQPETLVLTTRKYCTTCPELMRIDFINSGYTRFCENMNKGIYLIYLCD